MGRRVLITGGAGFIGSHLADELLRHGYRVRVLDNLDPQVHGDDMERPAHLDGEAELRVGDVRDPDTVRRAIEGMDIVFHLAAKVGVGQSMALVADFASVNTFGTGVLLDALSHRRVERLVVASSMGVYGEGLYRRRDGTLHASAERRRADIRAGAWEPRDERGELLVPVATPEPKPTSLASVYALTKHDQERMCLLAGRANGIPTVALRVFNAYGARQSLSNPYTGVLATFAARLGDRRPPVIFEDGRQTRDFVSVLDVARAFRLAAESESAEGRVINIGSGGRQTILDVAERMANALHQSDIVPEVTGQYRTGDIRHCFADIGLARSALGFEPRVDFDSGLSALAEWLVASRREPFRTSGSAR